MAWNLFRRSSSDSHSNPQSPADSSASDSSASDAKASSRGDNEAESSASPSAQAKDEKQGLFRRAWQKTWSFLNTDIRDLVGKEGRLVDDEFLTEFYAVLVKTDMGPGPAEKIREAVRSKYRGRKVHMHDLVEVARETVREILGENAGPIRFAPEGPTVILVVGVNGSGKTTSIAKLANMFRKEGRSVVLGAGDTFRAAAVEQLGVWAERIGAEIVKGKANSNPASVAYQAVERAVQTQADVCIVDTAGRLQTQAHLMDELNKVYRVLSKVIPDAPHEVFLVLDATAGQNAISQARGFSQAANCTGVMLAKLDGTAKGGVAIPIMQEFGIPVRFIGLGEGPNDIAPFEIGRFVNALFDDGTGSTG